MDVFWGLLKLIIDNSEDGYFIKSILLIRNRNIYEFNLDGAKELLEAALTKKQVWPWPQKDDEGYDDKVACLKKLGYREWKNKSASGKSQKWRVTHEEAMPG